jgi:hypothetical protein
MGKVNLNEDRFNDVRKIFNNGAAGVVQNLQVRVDAKGPEDHPQAPPFNLVFIDPDGGEISQPVFYLGDPTGDKKIDEQREVWAGSALRHMWHAIFGADTDLPEFDSMKQAVDIVMQRIQAHLEENPDLRFATVVNYGSEKKPQRFLTVKRFPPFIEPTGLPANESRLFLGAKDLKEPFVETEQGNEDEDVHTEDTEWEVS